MNTPPVYLQASTKLDPPRWPGGPPICVKENLPAFESEKALTDFRTLNAPSCKLLHKWECEFCGQWHADTVAAVPAGATSGTGRRQRGDPEPENLTGWVRRPIGQKSDQTAKNEPFSAKEKDAKRRKKSEKGETPLGRDGSLFT